MIRKIMLVAAFATSIIFSAERAVAQERRQVMLEYPNQSAP